MATHVPIFCPSCRLQRQIRLEYLGHRVVCRRCGHKFEARLRDDRPATSEAPSAESPGPALVAPAPGSGAEDLVAELQPAPVAPAVRPAKRSRAMQELREAQDWIAQFHDQIHGLHEQMEQARTTPGLAPAVAPPGQDDLRAERDALRGRVAELQRRAEESDRLEAQLRGDLTRIQGLLNQLQQEPSAPRPAGDMGRDQLREEMEHLRAERDRLAAELEELSTRREDAGSPFEIEEDAGSPFEIEEDAGAELVGLRAERDDLLARLAELEQQAEAPPDLGDVASERDELRARVAELEQQVEDAHLREGRLRADQDRVNNLWAQLEEGQATGPPPAAAPTSAPPSEGLAAELDAVRAERDRLAALVQEGPPSEGNGSLREELDAACAERDELRARVEELGRRAEKADRLEAQLRADQARANNLWAQLEEGQGPAQATPAAAARPAATGHEAHRKADLERINHLTAELRAARVERDHLATEVQDLRHQRDQEHDERFQADAERIERLEEELGAAGAERDRLAAEVGALRDERDLARADEPDAVRALREQMEAVAAERDGLRGRVAELERRTAEADRLEAQLRSDLTRVNGIWAQLEGGQDPGASSGSAAELEAVTRERDQLRGEVERLRTAMDRLQASTKAELEKANRLWADLEQAQAPGLAPEAEDRDAVARERDALRAERDQLRDEVRRLWSQVQVPSTHEIEAFPTEDD